MDWQTKQVNQSLKHASDHRDGIEPRIKDLSCKICYPVNEGTIKEDFNKFWEWYQEITSAERFSANAESVFQDLMKKNTENILEGRENFKVNALIYSIKYRDNSSYTIKDIRARIINMIAISEKFTRDMDEAAESYKTNSSKENSPKEGSPKKRNSPKIGSSKNDETLGIERELEETIEDIKKWDTSTDEMIDDEEIKERWKEIELRKIRRMEKAKDLEELESIKSEENPYSSIGKGSEIGDLENVKSEDLDNIEFENLINETEKEVMERKYHKLKEKFGEETEEIIENYKESISRHLIKQYEEKEIPTEKEKHDYELLKNRTDERRNLLLRNLTIEQIYNEILRVEKENNREKEEIEKEIFKENNDERIQEKFRKYNEIKEKIGEVKIQEELMETKKRWRENNERRIRYFEEKEMLTIRESQELENLKDKEWIDREELLLEEYVIDDIYTTLFEKEGNEKREENDDIEEKDKRDTKGKGKEIKNPFELNKEEEYTLNTVEEMKESLGKFIEEMIEGINEREEEKLKDKDKKVINTPENLSSPAESSKESSKESSEESSEKSEIIETGFDIYLEELGLENLFFENMALEYGAKYRTFEGRIDENLDDWIRGFERIADFNGWAADSIDRAKAAGVHLNGEALEVYDTISTAAADNLRWDQGNDANRLKVALKARFETDERKGQWEDELYETKQKIGENVDSFAIRFKKIAKKLTNTELPERRKATMFIRNLLPAIYTGAVLGKWDNLNEALESARRGEMSAMGLARQIIPEQISINDNRIFQDMIKEKDKDAMDEVMKKLEKLEIKVMNQMGNNRGNNRGNYWENNQRNNRNNIICYNCNETGHIATRCPNSNRRNTGDNRRDNRNYNQRNNGRNYNGNRNERSLNFLRTSDEDRTVQDHESSDDEVYINRIEIEVSDDEDNEYQMFVGPIRNTRSATKRLIEIENERIPRSESKKEKRIRNNPNRIEEMEIDEDSDVEIIDNKKEKMTRAEALQKAHRVREGKFKCRNCDKIGHFTANCPTLSPKEKEKVVKARERNKERKGKSFPINLEERIKELPCGLTVEEAQKMIPGYKKEFSKAFKIIKKREKVNYMEIPKRSKFTSMKSKAEIEDIEIDAIIDTGAAISAMTKTLIEELGYKINKSSNVVIVTADGNRTRSLGKIIDIELNLNGVDTVVTVEVIESKDRTLILGNDWLERVRAQIDMEKGKINIKGKKGFVDIPVEFSTKKDNSDEGSEEEYENEELEEIEL